MISRNIILLLVLFIACEDSNKELTPLDENQKKWQSHNLKSYRMNMNINCFCVPTADIDIRVENGLISLINGERFTKDDFEDKFWHAKTVEELFIFINEKLLENPFQKNLKFNSIYGYPEEIYFDLKENIADEEIGYIVHSFSPINDDCVDDSKISDNPCIEVYDPVCGCDGATYSNSCKALNAGLNSWVSGVCK